MGLSLRLLLLSTLSMILFGCGGAGSGSAPAGSLVSPQLEVNWAPRNRGNRFEAPASAQSVAIIFHHANADGSDLSFQGERPSPSGGELTYTSPVPVRPQTVLLTMNFHADSMCEGDLVGTVTATVSIAKDGTLTQPSGTPLGVVNFNTTIQKVEVTAPTDMVVTRSYDIPVTAFDANGPLVLLPGSAKITVTSRWDILMANGGTNVTVLKPGVASVVGTVDGIDSAPTDITVTISGLPARYLPLVNSQLVWDRTRSKVWALMPAAGDTGNSLALIDPGTGMVVSSITVGSNPTCMALSDDCSTMYVGLKGTGTVRRIDLATGQVTSEFTMSVPQEFGGAGYALDLAVLPGVTGSVAVAVRSVSSTAEFGPYIYDDGVQRQSSLGQTFGNRLTFTSPTRLVAVSVGSSPVEIYDYAIGPGGASLQQTVNAGTNFALGRLIADGDRLYSSDGSVLETNSLSKLGDFLPEIINLSTTYWYGPAINDARQRAYFVSVSNGIVTLHVYATDTFAELGSTPITGVDPATVRYSADSGDMMLWGQSGLLFRTGDRVVFLDNVPNL